MKRLYAIYIISFIFFIISCDSTTKKDSQDGDQQSVVTISMNRNSTYEFNTGIKGDQESAFIKIQAMHFEISEIIQNEKTNFEAVYRYKPDSQFSGKDYVELELRSDSDGAVNPIDVQIIKFEFVIN